MRLIKKYPNRRLYDTQTSVYITLADVKQMVLAQEEFQVVDAKSGDDLTRSILLQIILEEEAGGQPLFSSTMLSQMIRFYGNTMQSMMGSYLEKNLQAFVEIQNRIQEQSRQLYDAKGMPSAELWTQFMSLQAPMVQSMMSNYVDQSKNLFVQMQDQIQHNARNMFHGFQFPASASDGEARGAPPSQDPDPGEAKAGEGAGAAASKSASRKK